RVRRRGQERGQQLRLRGDHVSGDLIVEERLAVRWIVQLDVWQVWIRFAASPGCISVTEGGKITLPHRHGRIVGRAGYWVNLANAIVVDEEEELVANKPPADVPAELVAVERIPIFVMRVQIEIIRAERFVFIVFVNLTVRLIAPLLGDHRNRHLRTILGPNDRSINFEFLERSDRRQVGLGNHFVRAHVGDVAAATLPRVAGTDPIHGNVAWAHVGGAPDDRIGIAIDIGGAPYMGSSNFTVNGISTSNPGQGGGGNVTYVGSDEMIAQANLPSIGTLQDFKVDASVVGAEYRSQVAVSMVTKQGSNQFHGQVY